MSDDLDTTLAAVREALALYGVVAPHRAEGKNEITTARVMRDNGGYHGPADDVAFVSWDQIRALVSGIEALKAENEHLTTSLRMNTGEIWRTTLDERDALKREADELRERNRVISHQLERRAQGRDDLTQTLMAERDGLLTENKRLKREAEAREQEAFRAGCLAGNYQANVDELLQAWTAREKGQQT